MNVRLLFLLLLLLNGEATFLLAQEQSGSAEGLITLKRYATFLHAASNSLESQAIKCDDLYEEKMGNGAWNLSLANSEGLLRSGVPGNYSYAVVGACDAALNFLSRSDATAYCDFKNRCSSVLLNVVSDNLHAAASDPALRSNLVTFQLVRGQASLEEMTRRAVLWKESENNAMAILGTLLFVSIGVGIGNNGLGWLETHPLSERAQTIINEESTSVQNLERGATANVLRGDEGNESDLLRAPFSNGQMNGIWRGEPAHDDSKQNGVDTTHQDSLVRLLENKIEGPTDLSAVLGAEEMISKNPPAAEKKVVFHDLTRVHFILSDEERAQEKYEECQRKWNEVQRNIQTQTANVFKDETIKDEEIKFAANAMGVAAVHEEQFPKIKECMGEMIALIKDNPSLQTPNYIQTLSVTGIEALRVAQQSVAPGNRRKASAEDRKLYSAVGTIQKKLEEVKFFLELNDAELVKQIKQSVKGKTVAAESEVLSLKDKSENSVDDAAVQEALRKATARVDQLKARLERLNQADTERFAKATRKKYITGALNLMETIEQIADDFYVMIQSQKIGAQKKLETF